MDIAILGWGSLLWDPDNLEYEEKREPYPFYWKKDGPKLPIEFLRISKSDRLTLVIDPRKRKYVGTYYVTSVFDDLDDAIDNLAEREGDKELFRKKCWIGYYAPYHDRNSLNDNSALESKMEEECKSWLESHDYDAVIWTDLPPKFCKTTTTDFDEDCKLEDGITPESSGTIAYLEYLIEHTNINAAKKYIEKAPQQIKTPFREEIFEEFGWQCKSKV